MPSLGGYNNYLLIILCIILVGTIYHLLAHLVDLSDDTFNHNIVVSSGICTCLLLVALEVINLPSLIDLDVVR